MSHAYQPEIDGLRAVAVTAVIAFHSQIVPLPGGFAGVDVFFVLSGYLIAGILWRDLDAGQFTFRGFYERRVRRIFPALFVVLLATTIAAWLVLAPPQLESYAESLLAVVLFISNFLFAANSGYFSPALDEAPLLHTWSLSVEEQFYLLFPVILLGTFRWLRGHVLLVLGGFATASFLLAVWAVRYEPQLGFFLLFSRAWELLAGAIAAIWRLKRGALVPRADVSFAGMAAVLAAFLFHSEQSGYPGMAALLPVLGTVGVILFAGTSTPVGRMLAWRPMVAVGLISYSAYLWHQPLFALARATHAGVPSVPVMLGLIGLTFVLAALTWRWVEQPFRRPGRRWLGPRKHLFAAALAASVLVAMIAGWGMVSKGNDAAWRVAHPQAAHQLDLILTARIGHALPPDDGSCRFNADVLDTATRERIATCARAHGPALVIMGDSHAIDLFRGLRHLSRAPFLLGLTRGGCHISGDNRCDLDDISRLIADQPGDFESVVFVQSGIVLLRGPDGRSGNSQLFRRLAGTKAVTGITIAPPAIAVTADYLAQMDVHVPVTWISPRIEPYIAADDVLWQTCETPVPMRPGLREIYGALDVAVMQAAGAAGLDHVPLSALAYDHTRDFMNCDSLFWSDGDHWSTAGELRFVARLLPFLPPAFRAP